MSVGNVFANRYRMALCVSILVTQAAMPVQTHADATHYALWGSVEAKPAAGEAVLGNDRTLLGRDGARICAVRQTEDRIYVYGLPDGQTPAGELVAAVDGNDEPRVVSRTGPLVVGTSRRVLMLSDGALSPLDGVRYLGMTVGDSATGNPEERLWDTSETPTFELTVTPGPVVWAAVRAAGMSYGIYALSRQDQPATGEMNWIGAFLSPRDAALDHLIHMAPTDPEGAWVYSPHQLSARFRLARLSRHGSGMDAVVEIEPSPFVAEIPSLMNANLCAGNEGELYITGEHASGNLLVIVRPTGVETVRLPTDMLHGRRPVALVLDANGDLLVGTDGAGVISYDGEEWKQHPVTTHLPQYPIGEGLYRVDDILTTEDGRLYVASGHWVTVWSPE